MSTAVWQMVEGSKMVEQTSMMLIAPVGPAHKARI
jgi:hypothetical protein